jgi:hypothetical protein
MYDLFDLFLPFKCNFSHPELQQLYTQQPIPGYGDCLFHSLRLGIPELKGKTADAVRQEICDALPKIIPILLRTPVGELGGVSVMSILGDDKVDIESYIQQMRSVDAETPKYGTSVEIMAAQMIYNKNICIYHMNGTLDRGYELAKKALGPDSRLCEVALYSCGVAPDKPDTHTQRLHFELLIPKTHNTSGHVQVPPLMRAEAPPFMRAEAPRPIQAKASQPMQAEASQPMRRKASQLTPQQAMDLRTSPPHRRTDYVVNKQKTLNDDSLARLEQIKEDAKFARQLIPKASHLRDIPQRVSSTEQRIANDARVARHLQIEEDAKSARQVRSPRRKTDKEIAEELQLDDDTKQAIKNSLERKFKYKYLKYKTKYLTLKNNTNF